MRRPGRQDRGHPHGPHDPADAVAVWRLRWPGQELQDQAGEGDLGGAHPEGLHRRYQGAVPRDGRRASGRRHRRRGLRSQAAGARRLQAQGRGPLHRAQDLPRRGSLRLRARAHTLGRPQVVDQDRPGRDREAHGAGLRPSVYGRGQDRLGRHGGLRLPGNRERGTGGHHRCGNIEEGLRDTVEAQRHRRRRLRCRRAPRLLQVVHPRGGPGREEDPQRLHDVRASGPGCEEELQADEGC
mmetsp:Transcript_172405/g.552655  ORF Transcript_172405/g.552655 Transcript_172405/m.552655 type:complete len:240 (+) Transcript_172405:584-1303(+)